jgi:hypothetical protein
MLGVNFLPNMGYVPSLKVRAPVLFVPARTHSHQGPRVGALGGNEGTYKKKFPQKGNSPGTVPGGSKEWGQ